MSTTLLPTPNANTVRTRLRPTLDTVSEIFEILGDIPAERVRLSPRPGDATPDDVLDVDARENRICELYDGILVEKPMGFDESVAAANLNGYIFIWNDSAKLGWASGESGWIRVRDDQVRAPDVGYFRKDQFPGGQRPAGKIPLMSPVLAVEILSESNTKAEMKRKRGEYFQAGTRLVWIVDLVKETVEVYTSPIDFTTIDIHGTLTGGDVMPGFTLPLKSWFDKNAESRG